MKQMKFKFRKIFPAIVALLAVSTGQAAEPETAVNIDYRHWEESRHELRGYKGFVEAGYSWYFKNFNPIASELITNTSPKFSLLTSHGYQFTNYFYLGGGVGIDHYTTWKRTTMPIFGNIRVNLLGNNRYSPLFDLKGGYSIGEQEGLYVGIQAGVRVKTTKRQAAYAVFDLAYQYDKKGYDIDLDGVRDEQTVALSIGFKVGYEF